MKIAVIGSGIAGLTAAHLLSEQHEVWVYEKGDYIGGHTATVDVEVAGKRYAIDTGFIVFNDRTYPYFKTLLRRNGVAWQD
ncbi:MAG: FAD-dependent oxidoreductase, partial [Gammaproteobacteria bacterium]|nr:FAD-dependent oxidoreductase [Gammaproteobacteria bacterium]